MNSVPLLIVPQPITKRIARLFLGIGKRLERFIPGLGYDLQNARIDLSPAEYIAQSLVNAKVVSGSMTTIVLLLKLFVNNDPILPSAGLSSLIGIGVFTVYFILLMRYPQIVAAKRAEQVDKNLLFAIKDLMLQISSGVSLYNAFVNVSKASYGTASNEFAILVRRVKTGMPMDQALERLSLETRSEYLRRSVLQLMNTLRAGGSVKGALQTVISELITAQRLKIEDYAKELNLWTLVYMLFAVAIPSIGSTMMILLASFAGVGGGPGTFIAFITLTFCIQIALIGFIKTRRPVVHM